jgi:kinetochore protein Nuf2
MLTCGINDFMLTDIVKPDPSRLLKQLSGLINFFKFRQDAVESMSQYLGEIDVLRESQDKLLNERAELLAQIKAAK